jgi:hypothetical protein
MCRSIKVLRTTNPPATTSDVSAAALQFVRKVSGFRKPSRANEQVFNRAIIEISNSVERLLADLGSPPVAQHTETSDQRQPRAADQP